MIIHDDEYVNILSYAIKRNKVRNYVFDRLEYSLQDINIHQNCINDIIKILIDIYNKEGMTGIQLTEMITLFQNEWRPHLNRAYLQDYEELRWEFMAKEVLFKIKPTAQNFGRCLDVGCGRGCITKSLVSHGHATTAIGIDAIKFKGEWRERRTGKQLPQFHHVPIQDFGNWLSEFDDFDTVFLFYVLHHSKDYWVVRTLTELYKHLKPGGQIIILEDALFIEEIEEDGDFNADRKRMLAEWRQWANNDHPYNLSIGFDVQVVLDFVAVQILAGFAAVSMPCNYKTSPEWERMFEEVGFTVTQKINLGFPLKRDIDVPQAVFVLK